MAKPEHFDIEDVRAEARKYEQETGRPVDIQEKCVESSDGKRSRTFGWKTRKQKVGEAIALLRKSGFKPLRDEDGVVRLHCLELETPITAKDAKTKKGSVDGTIDDPKDVPLDGSEVQWQQKNLPQRRGHVEVTAWPIRSPETVALISSFLFEKGWDGFAPRELKEIARILEGDALRKQEPIDTATAAEWNPLLAGILHHFYVTCRGWQGTATELLEALASLCEIDKLNWTKSPDWPTCARSLSVELDRITPWLADNRIVWRRKHMGYERRLILDYAPDPDASDEDVERDAEEPVIEPAVDIVGSAVRTNEDAESNMETSPDAVCVGSAVRTTNDAGSEPRPNSPAESRDCEVPVPLSQRAPDAKSADAETDAKIAPASSLASVANSLVKSELGGTLTQTDAGFRDFSEASSQRAEASLMARFPNPESLTPRERERVKLLLIEELFAREMRELRADGSTTPRTTKRKTAAAKKEKEKR